MHILFIAERYPPEPGGLAVSASRVAHLLTQLGHFVHALVFAESEEPGRASSGSSDLRLCVHRFGPHENAIRTLKEAERLALMLHERAGFEATWGFGLGRANFLATTMARRIRVPLVLSVRGPDFDDHFYPPGDFARLEWSLRSASRITTASEETARHIAATAGHPAALLPNVINTAKFHPGPRPRGLALRYGLPDGQAVLGYSGQLTESKGMVHLLSAFRHVRENRPCKLLLIGDVHPNDRGEFQRLVHEDPRLASDVIRPGHLYGSGEVADHLRLCDVLLLPSLREGLPNGLLEALACEIPVVTSSAACGSAETPCERHGVVQVPRSQMNAYGARVLEVLDWPVERRRAAGVEGRAFVIARHSLDRGRELLASILEGLTDAGYREEDAILEANT